MSDQYGQQGQGGWQPQQGPGGWQPQPDQGGGRPSDQGGWQQQPADQGGWQQQQPGWQGQSQDHQQSFQAAGPQAGWQPQGAQQPGGTGGYPQGPAGWQPQGTPPKKRNLGVLITAAVVVLALAAGLTIWLVSKKDGDSVAQGGRATPQAAASDMMQSLAQKDAVGVAEQLDPTEADLFADLSGSILDQLKRLEIVKPEADPNALTSGAITVADLKFEDGEGEKVTDTVTVVKLIDGTVTVDESAMNLPYTDKIKAAIGDAGLSGAAGPQTYDISEEIEKNGGDALRIATVKRGDQWYPSLFYTLADNWLQQAEKDNPELADESLKARITAIGAGSPEQAVQSLLDQVMQGNAEGVIGMLPPDEMGVLYDYGKRMLAAGSGEMPTGDLPKISDLQFFTTEVDGGVKVSLKSVKVEADGQTIGVALDPEAGTITIDQNGQQQTIKIEEAITRGLAGASANMPPQIADMVQRLAQKAMTIGFVTTEVDGKWYVSPLRSFTGVFTTLLEALEPGDIDVFLQMAGR